MKIKLKIEETVDYLYENLKKISSNSENYSEKIYSQLICTGENLSVDIMQEILLSLGYSTTVINPLDFLLSDNNSYVDVKINLTKSINQFSSLKISYDRIILMAGFIAKNRKKELSTLGRNGSDYSASVLSACLKANFCEIWKDVDGIYSCDPNIVKNSFLIKEISYQDAVLFSKFGANILHHRFIFPIQKFGIPCVVKNTFSPFSRGTLITNTFKNKNLSLNLIKGITISKDVIIVEIYRTDKKTVEEIENKILNDFLKFKILMINYKNVFLQKGVFLYYNRKKIIHYTLKNFLFDQKHVKNGQSFTLIKKMSIISIIGDFRRSYEKVLKSLINFLNNYKIETFFILVDSSGQAISIPILSSSIEKIAELFYHFFFKRRS
ncbi:aspartate kinase [Candidatus Riesia pediculicola]|uniref:Aspartokinase n=1 Tax=Riesia pediculicola (strain USDA) TaxID=515618 RepID=D4G8W9_RIEPU|nr:aspartate kinase [Candidatus Riesia pediculicola]ADD79469.1 bifunctional aspartokinase/homoserine dehydrogenase I (AKI-HDI) [Candidatus Riesia pediculicola USDA]ARC53980.1 hypothetical protein AOE55_02405 [Candidatus Riesia pediculicola]QOJ86606.1 aspartate kinase [Candidatus Riesia pediculicola]